MTFGGFKNILLVEDDALAAEETRLNLSSYHYNVITALNGEKALEEILLNTPVDLILMDIDLGKGLSGPETAKRILKHHHIPVVFLSSHTEPELVYQTEQVASYGYISKNSGSSVLDASIRMAYRLYCAQEKLHHQNEKMQSTLNALPDLLIEVDDKGTCHDFHFSSPEHTEKDPAAIPGKKLHDFLPEEPVKIIMKAIAETAFNGSSHGHHYHIQDQTGSYWYEISVSRKKHLTGKEHFIILRRDNTERKKIEDALRLSEIELKTQNDAFTCQQIELENQKKKYEQLYHQAPFCYLSLDCKGLITDVNEFGAKMLNCQTSDLPGQPFSRFICPEDLELFETNRLLHHVPGSTSDYFKIRLRDWQGNNIPCCINISNINESEDQQTLLITAYSLNYSNPLL